ncbi:hypothetical protein A0H81_05232 [Grifola frondosa]|uniref:Meiotically up-regulated protein Msb1/Mug8 domain-containing protein n=1 Tax=Grifola frondosa TaxID=5627 RepID=A0A1C7MBX3_GRIFR|nr:hypothetical protein A0H81_05232 [Grifola frondosa]
MPAFLSKVFTRKKEKESANKRSSISSLLEGKFEAVSPTISPSATNFAESAQQPKEKERARKPIPDTPHLTLNLPVPKEERSRALGSSLKRTQTIAERFPTPSRHSRGDAPALVLRIARRAAAADLVVHSLLGPKSPVSTLSPSPTSPSMIFNTELEYTRSPHDLAAVLRWALRHLRLDGESFGNGTAPWQWYAGFAEAERASSYSPSAFTDASEDTDDWSTFYSRWERAGRIMEHLFLAHIRDEMVHKKMPLRLSELVTGYPYHHRSSSTDTPSGSEGDLLPRPRLSTRRYDALFVRVDTRLPDVKSGKPKQHPLRLIADALKSEVELSETQYESVWDAIRKAAVSGRAEGDDVLSDYPLLSRVFADETIRLLSLVPADNGNSASSSVPTIRVPKPKRSASSFGSVKAAANGSSNGVPRAPPKSPSSTSNSNSNAPGKDLASTLLDNDVEVTAPPTVSRKSSKKRLASPGRGRGLSAETPPLPPLTNAHTPLSPRPLTSKTTVVDLVKLDEAFIDFWSDAPAGSYLVILAQLRSPDALADFPRRASSPRPSTRSEPSSRKSSTFTAARRRFTFFSQSSTLSGAQDTKATPRQKTGPGVDRNDCCEAASTTEAELPPIPVVEAKPASVVKDSIAVAVLLKTEGTGDTVPQDIVLADASPDAPGRLSQDKTLPPTPEPPAALVDISTQAETRNEKLTEVSPNVDAEVTTIVSELSVVVPAAASTTHEVESALHAPEVPAKSVDVPSPISGESPKETAPIEAHSDPSHLENLRYPGVQRNSSGASLPPTPAITNPAQPPLREPSTVEAIALHKEDDVVPESTDDKLEGDVLVSDDAQGSPVAVAVPYASAGAETVSEKSVPPQFDTELANEQHGDGLPAIPVVDVVPADGSRPRREIRRTRVSLRRKI